MNLFLCKLLYAVAFLALTAADSIGSVNTTERYAATTPPATK